MISNLLVVGTAVLIQIKRGRTDTLLLACDAFFVDRAGHFLAEIRGAKRRKNLRETPMIFLNCFSSSAFTGHFS